jgi:hypothetical protein
LGCKVCCSFLAREERKCINGNDVADKWKSHVGIAGLRVEAKLWTQLAYLSPLIVCTRIDLSKLFIGSKLKVEKEQGCSF